MARAAVGRDFGVLLPVGPSNAAHRAWSRLVWFAHREPLGAVTAAIILVLLICAAGAGILAPYPYDAFDVTQRLLGPSSSHVFGTDEQGRDVFSRVLFGAQSSVLIGVTVVAVATRPNLLPVIIVNSSIRMGEVVLLSATLSFLGFGPPPPFPSWGRMLQESQTQMQYHPNLAVFPGLAIVLTVYAFNMLGDALRDVLDPRLRRTH
ncbi:MAG: ABC transporter permease subunit [Chloroflexi bacterium]|nr:ABC transporter permease subunit [Chloroflexota bacterium]